MTRVKRGVSAKKRHKKILELAKGYKLGRKNIYRLAKQAIIKAKTFSYRDRKVNKREFRRLWVLRINNAVRERGITYSQFIDGLSKADININRKVLSQLAIEEPKAFEEIVNKVKSVIKQ